MPVRSQEWEGKEETHDTPPANAEWNNLGLDLEWQVGVNTLLRRAVNVAQQHSGGGLEVSGGSGGSGGSQSNSGNHCVEYSLLRVSPWIFFPFVKWSHVFAAHPCLRPSSIRDRSLAYLRIVPPFRL